MHRDSPNVCRLRSLLLLEHMQLDVLFDCLLAAVDADATVETAKLWSVFEARLRAHMELEEQQIFPVYQRSNPKDAAQLLDEHAQIRAALTQLGIAVDLHLTRGSSIARFIELLRRHAAREDQLLYAWSEAHFDSEVRDTLLERLLGTAKPSPDDAARA